MDLRILWLEDDSMLGVKAALEDAGYVVERAYFLSEGDELLKNNKYDLLLIDALLPIEREDIAVGYTKDVTDKGNKAGLAFYHRHRAALRGMGAEVLVYSVVGDDNEVRNSFIELNVPEDNILYKVTESNVNELLQTIKRVLRKKKR